MNDEVNEDSVLTIVDLLLAVVCTVCGFACVEWFCVCVCYACISVINVCITPYNLLSFTPAWDKILTVSLFRLPYILRKCRDPRAWKEATPDMQVRDPLASTYVKNSRGSTQEIPRVTRNLKDLIIISTMQNMIQEKRI